MVQGSKSRGQVLPPHVLPVRVLDNDRRLHHDRCHHCTGVLLRLYCCLLQLFPGLKDERKGEMFLPRHIAKIAAGFYIVLHCFTLFYVFSLTRMLNDAALSELNDKKQRDRTIVEDSTCWNVDVSMVTYVEWFDLRSVVYVCLFFNDYHNI